MTTKPRSDQLTTTELYQLDEACALIRRAFGQPAYLVGSTGFGEERGYRDVDVRLMLDDEEFAAACPTRERWELLSLAIGVYLSERTGLEVDSKYRSPSWPMSGSAGPRNPLGMGRVFAGGGDGTPDWADHQ